MKKAKKYLALLALALCLGLTACGGGSSDDVSGPPDSFEGLVKDSERMPNLYVYGGA